jgi:hypothetical protein
MTMHFSIRSAQESIRFNTVNPPGSPEASPVRRRSRIAVSSDRSLKVSGYTLNYSHFWGDARRRRRILWMKFLLPAK